MKDRDESDVLVYLREIQERLTNGEPIHLEPIVEGVEPITVWPKAEGYRLN